MLPDRQWQHILNSSQYLPLVLISQIDGIEYYGYYTPVYQEGTSEAVGMIFAGAPASEEEVTFHAVITLLSP